jgi:hypothetical protein
MIILECPHCQSCYTAEEWNNSPHIGEDIPESLETADEYEEWVDIQGSGRFDCPNKECGEVAISEDMTVV